MPSPLFITAGAGAAVVALEVAEWAGAVPLSLRLRQLKLWICAYVRLETVVILLSVCG